MVGMLKKNYKLKVPKAEFLPVRAENFLLVAPSVGRHAPHGTV